MEQNELAPLQGGSEVILIAEDEPSVRKFLDTLLRKFGYEIILAEDGQDAVDRFAANRDRISLIVMDMIMPKKNGQEAHEEIRKLRPDVKVLYTSGYTADFIQNRGAFDDGTELFMKPVPPIEFMRKIREMLDR